MRKAFKEIKKNEIQFKAFKKNQMEDYQINIKKGLKNCN